MSPFKTLTDAAIAVAGSFLGSLVQNRFDNTQTLKKATSPVFIVHG